jgi:hypothetical protein
MKSATANPSLSLLEKEIRTLRNWVYGLALSLCACGGAAVFSVASGQAQSVGAAPSSTSPIRTETLTTDKLVVVDAQGRARIVLSVADGVGPSVVLYGDDGAGKAMLALSSSGAMLGMFDAAGRSRLRMGLTETIGPSLILKDEKDHPRTIVSVTGEKGSLQILDTNEKPMWQAP